MKQKILKQLVAGLAVTVLGCAMVTPAAWAQKNSNPGVMPPMSQPYGQSYAQWGADWWQWVLSIPYDTSPLSDLTGERAGIGQSGPVWFLAGTSGTLDPVERTCTIPAGKALFFPIVNWLNDYPCPDPSFQPPEGVTLEQFLTEYAMWLVDHATELVVEVDGVALQNLWNYRATSGMFYFTSDPSNVATDPCITGESQPGVTDGYWIMLAPLKKGAHTVRFYSASFFPEWDWGFSVDVTYYLTVQ